MHYYKIILGIKTHARYIVIAKVPTQYLGVFKSLARNQANLRRVRSIRSHQ